MQEQLRRLKISLNYKLQTKMMQTLSVMTYIISAAYEMTDWEVQILTSNLLQDKFFKHKKLVLVFQL